MGDSDLLYSWVGYGYGCFGKVLGCTSSPDIEISLLYKFFGVVWLFIDNWMVDGG